MHRFGIRLEKAQLLMEIRDPFGDTGMGTTFKYLAPHEDLGYYEIL